MPAPLTELEYTIDLPDAPAVGVLDQDEEYFEVDLGDERRRIRLHDYEEIFQIPGLYEQLYAESLSCDSPRIVIDLLADVLDREGQDASGLQVLDFAAGNGMVGEELSRIESGSIVGVDLLDAAKMAAERDRPEVYDAYHALDLTDISADDRVELEQHDFNCLTCVAALGFGDVPAEAFAAAFELVADGGWVAFNIRDRFIDEADLGGFGQMLGTALKNGSIVEHARVTYPHRNTTSGDPLDYCAIVGRKQGDLRLAA